MRNLFGALLLMALPGLAMASPVDSVLPGAGLRGEATFRYFGAPVYRGRLYTKGAAPFNWQSDFALELTYLMRLRGRELVDSTLQEFQRLGGPLPLRAELSTCFKDVGSGDRYLAVTQGPDRVAFWRNGARICTLSYPGIKRRFMEIFLGNNTRSAAFTRRIKGQ